MLPLGTAAPPFALPDVVSGETISLESFADKKALLVMFLCRHCKYVQHVKQALTTLGQDYQDTDLGIVAISANDAAAYTAACTPDFFLFDQQRKLVYRGQLDASRPGRSAHQSSPEAQSGL